MSTARGVHRQEPSIVYGQGWLVLIYIHTFTARDLTHILFDISFNEDALTRTCRGCVSG
jgi:hypothetical protein